MKLAALAFALLFIGGFAHADVTMPNTHAIATCVRITNLDDFPGIAIVGESSSIMSSGNAPDLVLIANGSCIKLSKSHYKFDPFNAYWIDQRKLGIHGIEGIKVGNVSVQGECPGGCFRQRITDERLNLMGNLMAPYAPYFIADSDQATEITFNYEIEKEGDGYSLKKTGEMKEYGDLPPSPPGPNPQSPAPQAGFFDGIICFFKQLFGQAC